MPVTIRQGTVNFKDSNSQYIPMNTVAEQTTASQVAAIQSEGATQVAAVQSAQSTAIAAIQTKKEDTLDDIPSDYTELYGEVQDLKSAVNDIVEVSFHFEDYLYKKDTYINSSMQETSATGVDLYKIPISAGDIVSFKSISGLSSAFNYIYRFRLLDSNGDYVGVTANTASTNYYFKEDNSGNLEALLFMGTGYTHIMAAFVTTDVPKVALKINDAYPLLNQNNERFIQPLSSNNCISSPIYIATNNNTNVFNNSPAYTLWFKIRTGDKIILDTSLTGLSYKGMVKYNDGTNVKLNSTDNEYSATGNGVASIFMRTDEARNNYLYPVDSFKLEYKNVIDAPGNAYYGLNGVAFGTSLTYRAQTTGGYLNYLPALSGITFDNQGLGSSTILAHDDLPEMLPVITNYAGYTGKRVCILEGFVNDWYYNGDDLGTWKDSGQTTVCGCVRYAIDYILTQNPNLTIFLVLDHFGKGITAADEVNSASQTQFEFYQEIEKVALSMGVRVIREYELSEISQLTEQYLSDNIHLNALGAKQSANAIWSAMKPTYPNEIS